MRDTGTDSFRLSLAGEQGERFLEEVNDETDPEWGGEGARDSALPLTTRDFLPNQDSSRFKQIVSPTRNSVLITDGGIDHDDGGLEHERCAECGGRIDPAEPGHYKSVNDEVFVHKVCYEGDGPEKVLELSDEYPFKEQLSIQYGCGHFASGPPIETPSECPECEVPAP